MAESVEYLLPTLRLRIGDIDETSYRYLDEWLLVALIMALRSLERYWGSKYIVTEGGYVTRNTEYLNFEFEETEGVIQRKDEDIIVIKAALIVLEGSLENSAWSIGSWRDAEIAVSNIESGRLRTETLRALKAELDGLIKAPTKRLSNGSRRGILRAWY